MWLLELGGLLQLDQLVCASRCIVGGQHVVSVRSSGEVEMSQRLDLVMRRRVGSHGGAQLILQRLAFGL